MLRELEAFFGVHRDHDHVRDFNARQFQNLPVSDNADLELNFNRVQKLKLTHYLNMQIQYKTKNWAYHADFIIFYPTRLSGNSGCIG